MFNDYHDYENIFAQQVYETYKNRWCGKCWRITSIIDTSTSYCRCRLECERMGDGIAQMFACWQQQTGMNVGKLQNIYCVGIPPTKESVILISAICAYGHHSTEYIAHAYTLYKACSLDIIEFTKTVIRCRDLRDPDEMIWLRIISREHTRRVVKELWEMDMYEFNNTFQWLPREMMEETLVFLY